MILAIDIGNTRTKMGLFSEDELGQVRVGETGNLEGDLAKYLQVLPDQTVLQIGWTSVANLQDLTSWDLWQRFQQTPQFFPITSETHWPINNLYTTPDTLGTDRIVSVIGARALQKEGPILVIDAGTALTFEVLDAQNQYLGGAISPGIRMRFRSLHEFTAKLPLIESESDVPLIGNSTKSCIQTGVINGILAEVEGVIQQYRSHFGPKLSVFLIGGDRSYFEKLGKNINFADPNLILRGIHFILKHQFSR